MTAYTKTTNFTAKDSLLVGNANKIIKGAEHDVEYTNIATAVNSKSNTSSPTFTGTANFTNIASGAATGLTLDNSVIGGSTPAAGTFSTFTLASGATATAILDEDNFASNSATALATQQSIKAYADTKIATSSLLDEDNMASNSATAVPSQQSTKAYVDAVIVATGPLLLSGTPVANDYARFTDGTTLEGRSYAEARADLSLEIGTDVQAYDATIVVDADIGVSVQAYDATIVVDADIGTTVQGYDADIPTVAASQVEIEAGTEAALRSMSPLRISQAVASLSPPSNRITATASGALADGSTVILNADETVSVVAGTDQALGTAVVFESANTTDVSAAFDSSANKVVIAYRDGGNSNHGTAVVGTVSGTSISFGTPVVFESSSSDNIAITYDPDTAQVVIAYRDTGNSSFGTAIVGAVSGTSITFGTAVVYESGGSASDNAITYDTLNNKVVISYRDQTNSGFGTAIVGTVSGTAISFGAAVVFESASTLEISATFDSNSSKVVIAYRDSDNSNFGTAIVGTVSDTSISFGTAVVFRNQLAQFISAAFDSSANKVVIAYRDGGNSDHGTAIVGTVSGTSITFGTAVVFNSAGSQQISPTFDSNSNKVVIAYEDNGNSGYGTVIVGVVSGTTITFGTPVVFESAATDEVAITFDSNLNKVVIAYQDEGNTNYGTSVVFQNESTNLTEENFAGFSNAVYADGASATVQTIGAVDDAQTGLTAGKGYYVQGDGSLGLTAGTPSVYGGLAPSATSIIVKG
jgi:hypothetical protein